MTRHGKCETCRKRKVRCDEKWPMCGQCSIKRRPCHYVEPVFIHDRNSGVQSRASTPPNSVDGTFDNSKTAERVTLRLKRHRRAQAGKGEFLTFEPVRTPSPTPVRLSPQPTYSLNLGSVLSEEALDFSPLGPWVKLAQRGNGGSLCVRLALQYALQSMIAFRDLHPEEKLKKASGIGVRALRSLQSSINSSADNGHKMDVVVAMLLHYAAEQFLGISSWRFIPHLQGVSHVLKAYFSNHAHQTSVQDIVNSTCCHEVAMAIHTGDVSQLETIARPPICLNEGPQLDVAAQIVDDFLIRLPRLVCAVRACTEGAGNVLDVIESVKQLLASEEGEYARVVLAATSRTTTSLSNETKSPTGTVIEFESNQAYIFATKYYLFRLILGGLSVTLASVADDQQLFAEAEYIELDAATSISECLDFALKSGPAQPLASLHMMMPLELGLGAWDRLQRRESTLLETSDSLKCRQAMQMKEWSIEVLQDICQRWRAGSIPRHRMETMYGAFVGEPLLDGPFNYMKADL